MICRATTLAFFATLALLGPWNAADAQDPGERAGEISRTVMSPFCPGLTLHDCPTQESVELRDRIEEWVAAGWSEDRIMARLESEYGSQIRAVPEDTYLVWLLPGAVLVGGLLLAYAVSRRWTRSGAPDAPEGGPSVVTSEERGRIDSELERMKERLWGHP